MCLARRSTAEGEVDHECVLRSTLADFEGGGAGQEPDHPQPKGPFRSEKAGASSALADILSGRGKIAADAKGGT